MNRKSGGASHAQDFVRHLKDSVHARNEFLVRQNNPATHAKKPPRRQKTQGSVRDAAWTDIISVSGDGILLANTPPSPLPPIHPYPAVQLLPLGATPNIHQGPERSVSKPVDLAGLKKATSRRRDFGGVGRNATGVAGASVREYNIILLLSLGPHPAPRAGGGAPPPPEGFYRAGFRSPPEGFRPCTE